ncbi:MAG TPA: hypothetical protein EYM65_00795 [Dehalococcoidia bacterium]|nr:hypothetical protein [Dehalococcoidia bacterium]
MLQRTLTAAVGIPVLVAAVWFGSPGLTVLIAVVAVLGVREFYGLRPKGVSPLPVVLGMIWAVAFVVGAQASSDLNSFLVISFIIMVVGAGACLLWLIAYYTSGRPVTASIYLLAGPVYAGFLLAHALALHEIGDTSGESLVASGVVSDLVSSQAGRDWLLFTLLIVFGTDTGAYLVGKTFGTHAMAPVISPSKTWEGAAGGFIFALVIAAIASYALDLDIPLWQAMVIGACVGVVTQAGDLFESKLKRMSNVKDASSIIPGHGGVLDRLDSVVVSIPLVYYLVATVFEP